MITILTREHLKKESYNKDLKDIKACDIKDEADITYLSDIIILFDSSKFTTLDSYDQHTVLKTRYDAKTTQNIVMELKHGLSPYCIQKELTDEKIN